MQFMLVLASQSPRRQEILARAGIEYVVRPANIDETPFAGEQPADHVRRLAREKAEAVYEDGEIVLGADTTVVVDGDILGKPADDDEAAAMLARLSGREHEVITGICLRHADGAVVDSASTRVSFLPLSDEEIRDYVASGEPMDKAGAYAIQGLASKFIDRIDGCYFNVVGLPMALVYKHLKQLSLLGLAALILCAGAARAQGVTDFDRSPHIKVHSVPVRAVTMRGFWAARMKTNVERSIPSLLALLEEHGAIDNFRRISGRKNVERRGPLYTDSDIYKWIEAAAFALNWGPNPKLQAQIDALTDDILSAQEPSGYLNTWFQGDRAKLRFTQMQSGHELYCLGHLLQAGIAYYRATGNRHLLDGGIRFANYMVENFGPEKRPALTGHPELEMAMVELYRTTGERKYLDFAGYLLSGVERERLKLRQSDIRYMFSGMPFTSRTQLEGHAVRAMYACSGATDYFAETGDAAYLKTLENLWQDMIEHKMYLTGGVGSRAAGEAFGEPYELPNLQAYTESCAAIANLMWNWRLLNVTGEARFADVMERALYNGANAGMSLDGTLYCYRNPLALDGEKIRNPWYDTTCCPPNLQRMIGSLPGYLYGTSAQGVYVHLFAASGLDWHLENGTRLKLTQTTDYPWKGDVEIAVAPEKPAEFTVFLRIPEWSAETGVSVNGQPVRMAIRPGEYLAVNRQWQPGDKIAVRLDMRPHAVFSNPLIDGNAGRAAVERGPLVYCAEGLDQQASLPDMALALSETGVDFTVEERPDMVVLKHKGVVWTKPLMDEPLYQRWDRSETRARKPAELTLIPYYTFANREPTSMRVWLPYVKR